MNDLNENQSVSQPRYPNPRQAQPIPTDKGEPKNSIEEPVREDLDQVPALKPPANLARRPVPISQTSNSKTDLRVPKILTPPSSTRQTNPLSTAAASSTSRQVAVVPRTAVARFDVPPPQSPQTQRTPSVQRSPVNSAAPPPVSLPAGIQRGFPRTPSQTNGNGRAGALSPVVPVFPAANEVARTDPEPELAKPVSEDLNLETIEQAEEAAEKRDAGLSSVPLLEEVVGRLATPPAQTAILGICDDGLPVLLDLNDPAPGAILVISDDDLLRTRLIHTLLQTTAVLNSPRSVQFLVLSSHPEEWRDWMERQEITRHCLGIERLPERGDDATVEGSPERWLIKLAGWADQRRSGSVTGPAVILLVDDLEAATALEYDARVNFDWLVKEGPAVRIWPVVALRTASAKELTRWVRLFKTRLLGPADDSAVFTQLSGDSEAAVGPTQFAVRVGERWLKFRIPILPDEVY